jgi:hypothetical protein
MLEAIFGSKSAEQVLTYISARDKGYVREISKFYATSSDPILKQLKKFEDVGVLVSFEEGRTRIYEFNFRYPFLKELKALLEKSISFYSPEEQNRLLYNRRRPRKKGKPL